MGNRIFYAEAGSLYSVIDPTEDVRSSKEEKHLLFINTLQPLLAQAAFT
jgi:heptaprenylglyceryl phosphate synthase